MAGLMDRRGPLYMVASALAFSTMMMLVKLVGGRLPTLEIVLARAVVSLVLSYALLARAGVAVWGSNPPLLLLRGAVGTAALSCVYYAVTHMPLAEATVIQYMHPALTALFAAVALGEAVSRRLVLASAVSLAGVVLVAKPSFLFGGALDPLPPAAVAAALTGAVLSAVAYTIVRRLASTENPLVIVFYFPLVAVPAILPFIYRALVWPEGVEWLLLLGVGVAAQIGQVALTRGIELLPAGRASALSYVQIVFATVFGAVVFAEFPDPWAIVGGVLVVAGTAVVSVERRPKTVAV